MRYLIQFGIPALILLGVIYAFSKRRRAPTGEHDDTTSVFLAILVIGAVVAVAIVFILQVNWNSI